MKSEAKQFLAEAERIEGQQRAGTWQAPPPELENTVAEQAEAWMRSRSHLSHATRKNDASIFNAWINPACGDLKLKDVRKRHLEEILAEMVEEDLSSLHRADVYSRFCMMMDHALGKGGHDLREVHVGTAKRERRIKPLTDGEWRRLLASVENAEWRLYVDVMGTLGLRPQECAALSRRQLSLSEGTVTIDQAVKSDYSIGDTKTGAYRTLPLPDHLIEPLREQAAKSTGETLWPWPGNRDLTYWRKSVWDPATEAAGLEDRVPYDLRHTCASKLIAMGATVIDVAEWMGHSKDQAMNTYGHLFPGRKAELASMLSRDEHDANVVELKVS